MSPSTKPSPDSRPRPSPLADQADAPSKSSSRQSATLSGSTPRGSVDRDAGDAGEQSPLLSPGSYEDDGNTVGEPDELQMTKSLWYLILLTISIGGLQIAWSVELSNGTPYLLSLGPSKALMALVWIAGPLTGTLVQPYVGMLSDNCRVPWGKRKPFMLGGAAATCLSLMILAWTREIVSGILGIFGADAESDFVKTSVIVTAVIGVYVLDFAINTVQAAIRAFIVDCCPAHQQEAANAMASRMTGFGNIIGYVAGYANLPLYLGFLGRSQFQDLCAIASIALGSTVLLSCGVIKERDPRLDGPPKRGQAGVISFFMQIFKSIKRLPPQIKKVCMVQFFAWVAFFPLLFYTSSYIGEIYVEPFLEENPHMTPEELDKLYEQATRIGTFALLINSIVALLTNVFLPFFIAPTYDSQPVLVEGGEDYQEKPSWLDRLQIPGLTLKRAWFLSLILLSVSLFCTVLVRTVAAATALIGVVGITWAMTLWAPWAIISAEISRRDAVTRARKLQRTASPNMLDRSHQSPSPDVVPVEEEQDQAGVILGIHNMAIAAPQIISTVSSSIIFRFFQKPRGTPGDHSIAIVLALGGFSVIVAASFVSRIKDEASSPADVMGLAEEGDTSRPGTSRSGQAPRASLERAALVRHSSFGGVEY